MRLCHDLMPYARNYFRQSSAVSDRKAAFPRIAVARVSSISGVDVLRSQLRAISDSGKGYRVSLDLDLDSKKVKSRFVYIVYLLLVAVRFWYFFITRSHICVS